MSEIVFGFDSSKQIKFQPVEMFKQDKNGKDRISIISFRTYHESVLAKKAAEAGRSLDEAEKAEISVKVDEKIASSLNKDPSQLSEVDRLDIKQPKFSYSWTHYNDKVGTIRCFSTYENGLVIKQEKCCSFMGDATQTIGTLVVQYPVDEHLQTDMELFLKKKYTHVKIFRMAPKKFKQLESTYIGAINDGAEVIDLKITLDGDPKFQKQKIESGGTATWAKSTTDLAIRQWVLQQGIRNYKHVGSNLGFEMTPENFLEKFTGSSSAPSAPRLSTSYDNLLK